MILLELATLTGSTNGGRLTQDGNSTKTGINLQNGVK